ncbi:MAG: hypothetical protein V4734_13215, partial [Terriglobus sp.]
DGPSSGPTKIITGRATAPEGVGGPATLPSVKSGSASGDWLEPTPGRPLQFRVKQSGATSVMPMYQVSNQKYSIYWQRS